MKPRELAVYYTIVQQPYLLYPRPQKTPHQKLEALEFRLYDDEFEIRLRIHIPRLVLHKLNLAAISPPPRHTAFADIPAF